MDNASHEEETDFWQSHSLKFLESAFRTDRQERIHQADGHGGKTGDCGDSVEFFLRIKEGRLDTITYMLQGCLNTNACANALIELTQGRSLEQAWEITPEDVSGYLETLPEDHFHCAELAIGAFYLALADARERERAPWKKMYS